ncbi:MAG TPA: UvrD-helicase domain-containing protein, partial [Planctomycetaceae bacterium]|nr:UvrD-helicase domain-containing protein [Planctomycetaceae bacterium]
MPSTQDLETILAELNEQQRAAAGHPRDPLLIIAGAGTGKTATLAHRVAWLLASGTDPGRILLLTFTRRAAAEMLRRVDQILERSRQKLGRANHSGSVARRIWGGTFHAVATRL